MLVTIGFLARNLVKINLAFNNQVFKFRSNRVPTGVTVDPNNWVINKVGSITTGMNDPVNVSHEVKIYPNPSTGQFYIEHPPTWFEQYRILDISGRLINTGPVTRNNNNTRLQLNLLPGVYMVQLSGKERVAVKKIVVH